MSIKENSLGIRNDENEYSSCINSEHMGIDELNNA